jgi:hypothetical protein
MDFDLWTLLVEQIGGGFWIAVLLVAFLIFLIMAVFGRMSRLTAMHYLGLYMFVMTLGYGYKWLTALLSFIMLAWLYMSWKNAYSG